MTKTNAVRILESHGITFSLHTYEVDDDLSGETVARKINAIPDSVFKTLVTVGSDRQHYVFCIPVTAGLDMKKAAKASGNKSIEMLRMADLLNVTGYIRGGCSPIAMKKQFPTFIDETAMLFDEIYCSAGIRGMQIKIAPEDLLKVISAEFADLI